MAAINSKKLLPGSEKKEVFLVPTKSIVPSAPKLDGVKPSEKKTTKSSPKIEGKIIHVTELFNNSLLLKAADREKKRKEEERAEFEEREKKLEEKKLGKKGQQESLVSKIPGSSLFDRLARFTGFTLLGFVFNNYSNFLPRLTALGAILKPAADGLGYFAEGLLSSTIDWINKGYKAYDTVNEWTKKLGGEDFNKLFTDFSGALNTFLNTAIIAGLVGIRGGSLQDVSLGAEAIKKSKSIFSGETAVATKNRVGIYKKIADRRSDIQKRKMFIAKRNAALRTKIARRNQELKKRNRARLDQLKENEKIRKEAQRESAKKAAEKQLTSPTTKGDPAAFFSGDRPQLKPSKQKTTAQQAAIPKRKKGPNTLRLGRLKYAEEKGGVFVDFGLPGQPTKRMSPEVAEGIKYMYEHPKDRYTKQIAYEAFKDPDLYEFNIKDAYKDSRRAKFRGEKMGRPRSTSRTSLDLAKRAGKQASKQALKRGTRLVPFIGPLLDVVISVLSGDPLDEAAVGAAGATLGSFLGAAIVGTGTFGLGAIIGAGLGGLVGDIVARGLYDAAKKMFMRKGAKTYAQGGVVESNRSIKVEKKEKKIQEPYPTRTSVGYFSQILENTYGETDGKNTVYFLQSVSSELKSIASYSGFLASLMGGSIDLLYGKPFDIELLRYIGSVYGPGTESAVKSAGDSVIRMLKSGFAKREPGKIKPGETKPRQPSQDITYVDPDTGIDITQTGRYGESRGDRTHKGEDLAAESGTPLRAISDGEIVDHGVNPGGWGNFIVLKDNQGMYHLYGHIQGQYKPKGTKVKKGDIVAKVGMSGRTTGPHLHWEVGTGWTGGVIEGRIDPLSRYKLEQPFFTKKEEVDLGPQSSTKKDDAQRVAMNTSYYGTEQILVVSKTYIQHVPVKVG